MRSSHPATNSRSRAAALARLTIASVIAILAITLLPTRSASAQRDVHATLIAKADRKPAPNFHLPDKSAKTVHLSDLRGKVVLVNFWATTCGGCVLEIPSFIALQQKYANSSFTAVGISADIPYDGLKTADEAWQKVRPFVAAHHINYPILMGNDAIITAFGFQAYPATYLIDRSGNIAATYVGIVSKDDVDANITKLLSEH